MTDIPISLSGVTAEWLQQQFHNAGHEDSEIISETSTSEYETITYKKKKFKVFENDVIFSNTEIIDETEPYSLEWNTVPFSNGSSNIIVVRVYDVDVVVVGVTKFAKVTVVVLFKIDVSVSSIKPNNLECLNGELKFCKSESL